MGEAQIYGPGTEALHRIWDREGISSLGHECQQSCYCIFQGRNSHAVCFVWEGIARDLEGLDIYCILCLCVYHKKSTSRIPWHNIKWTIPMSHRFCAMVKVDLLAATVQKLSFDVEERYSLYLPHWEKLNEQWPIFSTFKELFICRYQGTLWRRVSIVSHILQFGKLRHIEMK